MSHSNKNKASEERALRQDFTFSGKESLNFCESGDVAEAAMKRQYIKLGPAGHQKFSVCA